MPSTDHVLSLQPQDNNVSPVPISSVSGAVLSPDVTNGVEPVAVNTAVFSEF